LHDEKGDSRYYLPFSILLNLARSILIKQKLALLLFAASTLLGYTLWQNVSRPTVASFTPTAVYDTCYHQPVVSLVKAQQLTLAGERVPLKSPAVRRRLERELRSYLYHPAQIRFLAAKSRPYFRVIDPILKKHGIPRDFRYVVAIESGFDNTVVSRRGAKGVWQLMQTPAQEVGLTINHEIDERLHVEKATIAAAKHLKVLKRLTGSWTSALAAYNCGVTRYKRHAERSGQNSYYQMWICRETGRFVFKVMAVKELMERPAAYGLVLRGAGIGWPSSRRVRVSEPINSLVEFAERHGTDVSSLRALNPWLVGKSLTPKDKPYFVLIAPNAAHMAKSKGRTIRADSANSMSLGMNTDSTLALN
jgi:soluble lytic murein transglycosylase-like protein